MTRRRLSRRLFLLVPLLLLGAAGWRTGRQVHQARLDGELVAAVDANDVAQVKALLDRGANPNARPAGRAAGWRGVLDRVLGRNRAAGDPVILIAARAMQWPIAEDLVQHGADPNVRDQNGETPLWKAALLDRGENAGIVLAEHGADVDAPAWRGTPLMAAALSGKYGLIRALLRHGARTTPADPSSGDALSCLVWREVSPEGLGAARLLISHGCDPRCTETLFAAAFWGRIPYVRLLLSCGADPTAHDRTGRTPAEVSRDPTLRRLLLQAETDWRRKHPAAKARGTR